MATSAARAEKTKRIRELNDAFRETFSAAAYS